MISNFESFVERNPHKRMIERLFWDTDRGLLERRIASEREDGNWAAVATTAVFLSQFGYLTSRWYHLPDWQIMKREVKSEQPILECYNHMKNDCFSNMSIMERLSANCVHSVTVVNKQVGKQAWQQPDNYVYCLYRECSKAKTEKERVIYNRLIGILAELENMQL